MSIFNREFNVNSVKEVLNAPENAWFRDLLKYWRPAGDLRNTRDKPQAGADHLRLAIRDGYLNFYRAGQSVPKVTFTNGKLEASVHNKYVYGNKNGGKAYIKITDGGFTGCDGTRVRYTDDLVHHWILAASDYAEGEKLFVDELVGSNANAIDLEAGLPADPELWDEKSAPRMDLVSLEPCGNHWRLAFWEAKLVKNSEARCQSGLPEVVGQLEKYQRWLEKNRKIVCEAYRRTCADLVQLHGTAKVLYPEIGELGNGIVAVAGQDASELCFDSKPRLIVDDSSKNAAFTQKGHLQKLRDCGVHIHMVRSKPDMALSAHA
jgi:hypothetical protein